jgi:polyhydroxybutyrate depolymerase
MTNGRQRRSVLVTVLALLSIPGLLALVEAVSFHLHNRDNGAIVSSGQRRTFLLHVPGSYDPARPTPLVISLHGAAVWPAVQRDLSRWNALADEHGFIVVYPSGLDRGGSLIWRVDQQPGFPSDVQFISDLIDELRKEYNIDPTRIYADGLSNGAGMAFALSCTLTDRIAAVGMVASALLLPWDRCTDRRPVPVIMFHGTDDRLTPYHGGTSAVAPRPFPAVPAFAATWAGRNGCAPDPTDTLVAPDVSRRAYVDPTGDATVVLYAIRGGGHTWPGGTPLPEWFAGSTSNSVDATREMWEFFRAHPLRRPDDVSAAVAR